MAVLTMFTVQCSVCSARIRAAGKYNMILSEGEVGAKLTAHFQVVLQNCVSVNDQYALLACRRRWRHLICAISVCSVI